MRQEVSANSLALFYLFFFMSESTMSVSNRSTIHHPHQVSIMWCVVRAIRGCVCVG